jgi:hypothetical protein
MPGPPRRPPSPLLRRWEELHPGVQIAIVAPLAILLLWAVHVGMLNQPAGRGFGYGVFWGLLVTAAVVGAGRAERARRLGRRP